MNEQLTSVLQIVASYIIILLIGYLGMNFLTAGFITKFIAVKSSRGKKVLIEIHAVGDVYYRTGIINESILQYKDREKQKKSVLVDRSAIFYKAGVKCLFIDDVKNAVMKPDFSVVPGFDAVKFDNLLVRAMTNPALQDKFLKVILIVVIVLLFLTLANTFVAYKTQKVVSLLNYKLDVMVNASRVI